MKKLYLHIGHYKTGTSAIQKYCSEHADVLAESGYFYPPTSRPRNNRTNHGDLSLTLAEKHGFTPPPWYQGEGKNIEEVYRAFFKSAQGAEQDTILISSEEFLQLALREDAENAIKELRARLNDFDVNVVFYIREPLSLLKSWYNEVNKGVGTRNFIMFFMALNENFLGQLPAYDVFAKVFGPENVLIRTYNDKGSKHIEEFFRGIGLDHTPAESAGQKINKAQDIETLELRRLVKRKNNTSGKDATLSQFGSLKSLSDRIDQINKDFTEICGHSDVQIESELSVYRLFEHLNILIQPLIRADLMNPKEAELLRDAALEAESSDIELAALLMKMAQSLRPNGPLIGKKVQEYQAKIDRLNASAS